MDYNSGRESERKQQNTSKFTQDLFTRTNNDDATGFINHSPLPSQYNQYLLQKSFQNQQNFNQSKRSIKPIENQTPMVQTINKNFAYANDNSALVKEEQQQFVLSSIVQKEIELNSMLFHQQILYSQDVPTLFNEISDKTKHYSLFPQKYLRFEIEIKQQSRRDRSSTGEQILSITLTDEQDPDLLYFIDIDQQMFLKMKREQNLLVEFSQFSEKIMTLLDFCITKDEEQNCRFLCVLYTNNEEENEGAIVDIFEHNEFRHLLHLQLTLKKATDQEASKFLAKKLLISKKVNNDLYQEKEMLIQRQEQDYQTMEDIRTNLKNLKDENERMLDQMQYEFQEKEKEKQMQHDEEKCNLKEQFNQQKHEIEQYYQQKINSMEKELNKLKESLNENNEVVYKEKSQLQDYQHQLTDLNKQNQKMSNQISEQSEELMLVKEKFNEKDKEALQLQLQKQQLEKEVQTFHKQIEKDALKSSNIESQNNELKQQLEDLKQKYLTNEEHLKQSQVEIERLNKEARKQRDKYKQEKQKRKEIKHQCQQLLEEIAKLEERIKEKDMQLVQSIQEQDKLNDKMEDKSKQINDLEVKLRDSLKTLQSNTKLIEYLNSKLNEAQKFNFKSLLQTRESKVTTNKYLPFKTSTEMITSQSFRAKSGEKTIQQQKDEYRLSQSIEKQSPYQHSAYKRSQQSNLPLTDYYLNKKKDEKITERSIQNKDISQSTSQRMNVYANHMERDKIISEDKLKQRFEYLGQDPHEQTEDANESHRISSYVGSSRQTRIDQLQPRFTDLNKTQGGSQTQFSMD